MGTEYLTMYPMNEGVSTPLASAMALDMAATIECPWQRLHVSLDLTPHSRLPGPKRLIVAVGAKCMQAVLKYSCAFHDGCLQSEACVCKPVITVRLQRECKRVQHICTIEKTSSFRNAMPRIHLLQQSSMASQPTERRHAVLS